MKTHKGHEVAVIEGDSAAISDRGTAITTLATQMTTAASTLQDIKSGKLVGKGYAMDKIKDVIGDVHGDLDEAGRRYKPAGKTLTDYAGVLATVQAQMKTIVGDCETSEKALATAQSDATAADSALTQHNTSVSDHPPAPDQADASKSAGEKLSGAASSAHSMLTTANETHDHNLGRFDTAYDTWDEAYEHAVNGLGDANKIGKDSTWENIAGVLAVISEWVSWIGLAIAVLGLIIGGPFFAIAALVVGVIALALTVALMFDGRKGWGDLAWAIVGVLPIGKLGQGFGKFFKAIPKQLTGPLGQIRNIRGITAVAKGGWKAGTKAKFGEFVTNISKTRMTGPFSLAGLGQRFLGGANRSFTVAFQEGLQGSTAFGKQLASKLPPALADMVTSSPSKFEQAWNVYKWADKAVAVTQGKPSGGLSPAKMINGWAG